MRSTILWNDLIFFETLTYETKIPPPCMPFMPFTTSRLEDLGSPVRDHVTRDALRAAWPSPFPKELFGGQWYFGGRRCIQSRPNRGQKDRDRR